MKRILSMLLGMSGAAHAAGISVDVRDGSGRPVSGAVVMLEGRGFGAAVPRGSYVMSQRNIAFDPHVLVVPVGATVTFPNRDKVRHHVYSFSKTKKFELKLYGHEEARAVTFDKPGPVALGCNIHDRMSGMIYVSAARFADATDAAGRATFADVPQGRAMVVIWDPSIQQPGNMLRQMIDIPASGSASTTVIVR